MNRLKVFHFYANGKKDYYKILKKELRNFKFLKRKQTIKKLKDIDYSNF